jgi:transcriptional regulator with XRE-family HTH domain
MANHVKARRKELKLTQQDIADAAGTTKATVMKLERGHMQLTENWLQRLSVPLKCRPEDLIMENWPDPVPVIGKITDKSLISLFKKLPDAGMAEADSTYWNGMDEVPQPPGGEYRDTRALRVEGDALEPILAEDSLVYFTDVLSSNFDEYIDSMVVCESNSEEIHIARLKRGYNFGSYNLMKPNGKTLEDVSLNWCGKVVFFKLN